MEFSVKDVNGNIHSLFDVLDNQGQYVLVDFFAVGWGACQNLAPKLDTVYNYFGKNELDLFIIGIDQRATNDAVIGFENEFNTHYPSVSGNQGGGTQVFTDYKIPYTPSIILIAPDHTIMEQEIPRPTTAQEMIDLLETYDLSSDAVEDVPQLDFKIFPNPVQNVLTIQSAQDHDISDVHIYQLTGQEVLKNRNRNDQSRINVSSLQKGIYLISVEYQSGKRVSKTFVKQ